MFESVLAWDRMNQTRPSVSMAAINDNLGETELSWVFPLPSLSDHVLRVKLVSLIQDSSILITLLSRLSCFIISSAYCCRSTSARSELAWGFSFLVLTKLSFRSCRMTYLTSFSLTSRNESFLTRWQTSSAFDRVIPSYCIDSIADTMASLSFVFLFSYYFFSLNFSGLILKSATKSLTSCVVTRNVRATSFWGTYCFM